MDPNTREFWYVFVTIYLASVCGMAWYHKKEAEYEDVHRYSLTFFDWLPFFNTCVLFVLSINLWVDRYRMQSRMVKKAKEIIERDNKKYGSF